MKTFKEWLVEMLKEPFPTIPPERNRDIKLGGFKVDTSKTKPKKTHWDKRKEDTNMGGYHL